jgi:hypothetical protein
LNQISGDTLLAGAAITVERDRVQGIAPSDKAPEAGDLVVGRIKSLGEYDIVEDRNGVRHPTQVGSQVVFVLGHRYAPDVYEGVVPERLPETLHQLSRSGVSGVVVKKNAGVKEPTRFALEGYACDADGAVLNTRRECRFPAASETSGAAQAKLIVSVGTSMSSGKSTSAAACCWALSRAGRRVGAAKITGTASRRDILLIRESGADPVAEFADLGYPSTHRLPEEEVVDIFSRLVQEMSKDRDLCVIEISDGILQRETAMLLRCEALRSRMHRLVFSATDALGAFGGIQVLRDQFGLVPDALSGTMTSSPLAVQELESITSIPVFDNLRRDQDQILRAIG